MFKDILTFLGVDYRDASPITMYFVVLVISIPKNQINQIILSNKNLLSKSKKSTCLKWTYEHSGNDYRFTMLFKSNLITTGIAIQSLKTIRQF